MKSSHSTALTVFDDAGSGAAFVRLSRAGTWSFVGGVGLVVAGTVSSSAVGIGAAGLGFLVSGAAFAGASGLLLKKWRNLNAVGRVGALVAAPFGASMLAVSVGMLGWIGLPVPMSMLGPAFVTMLVLALVLGVVFGAGVLRLVWNQPDIDVTCT